LLLAAGLGLFLAFRLDRYIGFSALKEHRTMLMDLVERHAVAMAVGFVAVYALAAAFSLPIAAVLSISGGFLFGQWLGTVLNVLGATAGATAVFLAARTAIGDSLRRRAGPWLARMEEGFRDNALCYLLVLRLVPLFPFVAVNLVPAMLGVGLRDFVVATFIGIIPGAFVYTAVGAGLGSVFDAGGEFRPSGILTPQVITALVGLACLALVPVVYKKLKRSG
jgi:uncharacterized membrane protein YdjX (TVP38/TMEM64 family)